MVKHSNGHDPHTGIDVGDALPWIGRDPWHNVTLESRWCRVNQEKLGLGILGQKLARAADRWPVELGDD